MRDAVALIDAVAWPLVALAALLVLRKALPEIAKALSQRVTTISFLDVSIGFATVPEMEASWQAPGLGDVRQPQRADLFDAPAAELLTQFHDESAFDYAVVDLGDGRDWLSSRLFVFAEMLPRLRRLRCFVFVESAGSIRRRLVGLAQPEAVRWGLAHHYPWLEEALESAYASQGPNYLRQKDAISATGAVSPWVAQEIGRAFLRAIQAPLPPATPSPQVTSPREPIAEEWVPVPATKGLPAQDLHEHGEWLGGAHIEAILGAALQQDAWVTDDPSVSDENQVKAVLRRSGDLVAMVQRDMAFSRLVDRRMLLDEIAVHQLRQ